LLELLEDVDPDTPVRIAHQPSWPLALTVSAVRAPGDDFPEEVECPGHPGYQAGHTITASQADARIGYIEGEECPDEPDDEDDSVDRRHMVWIVAIDHPRGDESPYAPHWVFED